MTDIDDMPMRNPDCIYNQIEDVLLEAWRHGYAHGHGDGTQPSSLPTGEMIGRIRRHEINHLWSRAGDSEVRHEVADSIAILLQVGGSTGHTVTSDEIAVVASSSLLTALIGPKEGSDDESN